MKKNWGGWILLVVAVAATVVILRVRGCDVKETLPDDTYGEITAYAELYDASMDGECVGLLQQGNTVLLLAEENGMTQVQRGDVVGWVDSTLVREQSYVDADDKLTYVEEEEEDAAEVEIIDATVSPTPESTTVPEATPEPVLARPIEWVNLRSGPGVDYEVLMVVQQDQLAIVLDDSGAWWNVNVEGVEGWIYSTYLEKMEDSDE